MNKQIAGLISQHKRDVRRETFLITSTILQFVVLSWAFWQLV